MPRHGPVGGHQSEGIVPRCSVPVTSTDSTAAKAGLREGDILLRWNDGEVPTWTNNWLAEQHAGDKLKLIVLREEKELTLEIRLGETRVTRWQVVEAASPSKKAKQIRNGLLRGVTENLPGP